MVVIVFFATFAVETITIRSIHIIYIMAEQNDKRRRAKNTQPIDQIYGHLMPQALQVEKAVIGALMIDKDAYPVVCEMLTPQSF